MSDETPGVGQGPPPPREGPAPRSAVRLAQVQGGQYVLTTQSCGVPALAQVSIVIPTNKRYLYTS